MSSKHTGMKRRDGIFRVLEPPSCWRSNCFEGKTSSVPSQLNEKPHEQQEQAEWVSLWWRASVLVWPPPSETPEPGPQRWTAARSLWWRWGGLRPPPWLHNNNHFTINSNILCKLWSKLQFIVKYKCVPVINQFLCLAACRLWGFISHIGLYIYIIHGKQWQMLHPLTLKLYANVFTLKCITFFHFLKLKPAEMDLVHHDN